MAHGNPLCYRKSYTTTTAYDNNSTGNRNNSNIIYDNSNKFTHKNYKQASIGHLHNWNMENKKKKQLFSLKTKIQHSENSNM